MFGYSCWGLGFTPQRAVSLDIGSRLEGDLESKHPKSLNSNDASFEPVELGKTFSVRGSRVLS